MTGWVTPEGLLGTWMKHNFQVQPGAVPTLVGISTFPWTLVSVFCWYRIIHRMQMFLLLPYLFILLDDVVLNPKQLTLTLNSIFYQHLLLQLPKVPLVVHYGITSFS